MAIIFSQKITISSQVLSQEVAGETVLLDLQGESYFGLNEVGTRVWQLLQDQDDMQLVFDTLMAEYDDVKPEQLEQDLRILLKDLSDAGLIEQ